MHYNDDVWPLHQESFRRYGTFAMDLTCVLFFEQLSSSGRVSVCCDDEHDGYWKELALILLRTKNVNLILFLSTINMPMY